MGGSVQVFQTEAGIARREGERLALLDVAYPNVTAVVAAGQLGVLREADVTTYLEFAETAFQPVVQPSCFIIAGLNYRAHCEEIGRPIPQQLVFGEAPGSAAHGAGQVVTIPTNASTEVDYEGEIGVVIGTDASDVTAADAWSVVAGLVPLNDVSARDVQAGGTLEAVAQAKGFPTFKPLGPCLATLDEFPDPSDISLTTKVNGEVRQQGRSADMVFSIPEVISIVTSKRPLKAGDVICTGTPGGVAHGGQYPYLQPGDIVQIEVDGLPALTNKFS